MKKTIKNKALTAAAVAAGAALLLAGCSSTTPETGETTAPSFPTKNITIVIPFDAGGSTDLSARTLASEMEKGLGQSIIAENRSGASGSVGMEYLAKATPDGYTIGILTVEAAMLGHKGFNIDPANYDVLGQVVAQTATIAVPMDSPYKTFEDLIAAAKANPGTITVANSGAGGNWEAVTSGLGKAANVEFKPIPFEGGAAAVTAAMGNQVDAVVAGISEVSQAHLDKTLRVLAVLDTKKADRLPDVPAASEFGVDISMGSWHIIAAPKGLPADVKAALVEAVKAAQGTESFSKVILNSGNVPFYRSADEATTFIDSEYKRFADFFGK
ncbi:MAG: tripartite tricarboxylate transporter substrate binding protein [Microbacteriaceae bacterium]